MKPKDYLPEEWRKPSAFPSAIARSVLVALLVFTGSKSWAATNIVTSGMDSVTGNPGYSGELRYTINHASPGDTIMITFQGTIQLSWQCRELDLSKNLTIIGPGADKLTVFGTSSNRVFTIDPLATATLSDLTIAGGHSQNGINGTSTSSGGPGQPGGGVYNAGTLTLINCVITSNGTGNGGNGYALDYQTMGGGPGGPGGGIYNTGTLMLSNSVVANNSTGNGGACGQGITYYAPGGDGGPGGGIYSTGVLFLANSTIRNNYTGNGVDDFLRGPGSSGGSGGGIWSGGTLVANGCTWNDNNTGYGGNGGRSDMNGAPGGAGGSGGAIWNAGNSALTNCSFTRNVTGNGGSGGSGYFGSNGPNGPAGSGAGIYNSSNFFLVNCTISTNRVGGGVNSASGSAYLLNSLVALNSGNPQDVTGAFASLGHNLIGVTNGSSGFIASGDLAGSVDSPINPKLGPLADNGGPTLTMALLPGSPAIDAGDNSASPPTDQRGLPRPFGASADIGAYEYVALLRFNPLSGDGFEVSLRDGIPDNKCLLMTSTDFLDWQCLATNQIGPDGTALFPESYDKKESHRFYRALLP
jgi:hypothetical protein